MALGKVRNEILSNYSFMKENTFVTKGKHLNLLLHVDLAAWVYSPDNISMIDCVSGAIIPCQLPIEIDQSGWWSIIGSEYGMLCLRYSINSFNSEVLVWNPLLKSLWCLEDPVNKLCRQAMIGYAFGFTPRTDKYFIVHVSKRNIRDRFLHCNVYDSAYGEWRHGYIKDQRLKNLGGSSVVHRGKAFWNNWVGRQSSIASDTVIFDVVTFKIQKIKIIDSPNQAQKPYFQSVTVFQDTLCLMGYETSNMGWHTMLSKVDIETFNIVRWRKFMENRQRKIHCNPSFIIGENLIRVHERIKSSKRTNLPLSTEVSVSKVNMITYKRNIIYYSSWPYEMCLKYASIVSQRLIIF
ncbi:uncharacterized protein LOC110265823 [Arachis ipaensis]|uniref:uncharacterized protein LOC110265823 n=1 Tax=Arachis ipaensis TaxID=130454 RepID=UPI000A2AF217|nr:uncharacterized protein LOC110265823 [Arachis ipaensis]